MNFHGISRNNSILVTNVPLKTKYIIKKKAESFVLSAFLCTFALTKNIYLTLSELYETFSYNSFSYIKHHF